MPTAEQEVSGSDKMDTDGGDVVTQGSDTEDPKHPIDHINGGTMGVELRRRLR